MSDLHRSPALVLIVEDDPLLMLSMVSYVEDAGCEAVEAGSVAEAITILEERADIRTVFADLDVRGSVAGLKLAVMIRDRWPPIELLLISSLSHRGESLPDRGILVGKPFDQRKIVAALRRLAA